MKHHILSQFTSFPEQIENLTYHFSRQEKKLDFLYTIAGKKNAFVRETYNMREQTTPHTRWEIPLHEPLGQLTFLPEKNMVAWVNDDWDEIHLLHMVSEENELLLQPLGNIANLGGPIGPILSLSSEGERTSIVYVFIWGGNAYIPRIHVATTDLQTPKMPWNDISSGYTVLAMETTSHLFLLTTGERISAPSEILAYRRSFPPGYQLHIGGWGMNLECIDKKTWERVWHVKPPASAPMREGQIFNEELPRELLQKSGMGGDACLLQGPQQETKTTLIMANTVLDIFRNKEVPASPQEVRKLSLIPYQASDLLWLDDKGDVLGYCQDPIGIGLHLQLLDHDVFGFDMFQGQRRLWKWSLHQEQMSMVRILEQVGEEAYLFLHQHTLYVIEQCREDIQIRKYDTESLDELDELLLPDSHLETPMYDMDIGYHLPHLPFSVDSFLCFGCYTPDKTTFRFHCVE